MRTGLVMVWLTCAACSSGGATGPIGAADLGGGADLTAAAATSVQGTVQGISFGSATALTAALPDTFGNTSTIVDVSDGSSVCKAAMNGSASPDGNVLSLALYGPSTGEVTAPATLTVINAFAPQKNSAQVHFTQITNHCPATQIMGASGSVTVDAVDAGGVTGHFSIHFQGGGDLTGTFVAPPCPALANWNPPTPPGC